MKSHTPTTVRLGLVGVFALLAVVLLVPTVSAQFGPRPPGMPNFPRPPAFPNFPDPLGRGDFGGIPETVYSCRRCNTELGRGAIPPAVATCACGLTYRNGVARTNDRNPPPFGGPAMPGLPGMPGPPFNPNPGTPGQPFNPGRVPLAQPANTPKEELPELEAVSAVASDNRPLPPVDTSTPGSPDISVPVPVTVTPPKSSNRVTYIIGGVLLALLVVLGMILGVLYVKANAKKARPVRRRRPVRDDGFDDD